MEAEEFESLIQASGLNLLSKWAPRFLVSLRVPTEYGVRIQCGRLLFASPSAFLVASTDEVVEAIAELKTRLSRASQTIQGDVARGGNVEVVTKANVPAQAMINYPAH